MKPLVVIGLDGANWPLLNKLMKRGVLPNFKKIYDTGISKKLKTIFPPHTAAAWSSFSTGKNPGKHGVFEWSSIRTNLIVNRDSIESDTFYEILFKEGFSIGIVNLPLSDPPKIKGDMIACFASKSNNRFFPKELETKLDSKDYIADLSAFQKLKGLEDNVLRLTRSQVKTLKKMYENKEYDFFFYLFSATDWLQHSDYDILFNKKPKNKYRACMEVFNEIDNFFGWLIKKDINLIVMSDHGFQKYPQVFYVNSWLESKQFLTTSKEDDVKEFWGSDNKIIKIIKSSHLLRNFSLKLLDILHIIFPSNIFIRIESNLGEGIDLLKTKAFCPRSELSGIYINDERFKNVVKTKKEYDELREKIINGLNATGFIKAVKKEKFYSGKNFQYAPDILLIQDQHKVQRSLIGKITRKLDVFNHNFEGVFLAHGDFNEDIKEEELSILHIAPTILNYFNIKPQDMDMQPLNLFSVEKPKKEKRKLKQLIDDIKY